MNIFSFLTPMTYWVLIVMWLFIFGFYIKRLRSKEIKGRLISVLIVILAIDAFRTLFESLYFGAWYTALAGFLPKSVHTFLIRPEMVFIPKILNVVAAAIVLGLLIFKWLPREASEIQAMENERGELQSQLFQAQKMESVGRLAGGVAHDYNNMLTIINGYAESILDDMEPDNPHYEDITEILNAGKRSSEINRQLLAFARRQTTAPKVVDLNETIDGTLKMLQRLIGENIDLACRPMAETWLVKIDPSQVDQILVNLCVNARDAIHDVGHVTIETKNIAFDETYCADHAGFIPGEYVMLAVSDSGSGMTPDVIEKMFDPFFTTKGLHRGSGLGLSTVYGIIKQNNGFINVYSELGNGTVIRCYFPKYAGQKTREPLYKATDILAGNGETILIVEDDQSILKLGVRMLNSLGYTVLSANTPGDAIGLAEEHKENINLLITDVVMPDMNGRELSDQLSEPCPRIKTLYMSGYTANVIAHQGVLDEDVFFISKPLSKKELAGKIREVLDLGCQEYQNT